MALISLVTIGEFVMDLNTPLRITDWVWYCIPLLLSAFAGGRSLPFLLAAVFSALTLAGLYLSPAGIDPGTAFISRMIGIGVFWVMAFLIWQRKQTDEAMRRRNEYLTALQETMLDVASQLDLDRLLENILKRAGQLIGTSTGFLDLLEPGDDHLTPKIALGVLAEESLKYKNRMGEGLGGKVWQTGRTILVEDYDAWPERIKNHQINLIRSIMAVPLMSKSGFVGVLGLAHEKKFNRTFGPDAIQQLNQFARFATLAIENARLYSTARHELTQRKQAEEALRESQALYHSLVEQMPAGVFRKDRAGRFVYVNSRFCQSHSLTADEIIGRTTDELVLMEAARGPKYSEILGFYRDGSKHHEEILRTGKPIHFEEAYTKADGSKWYLHVVKSPVFGPEGQIIGTQGVQFDITEVKRVEADLARERHLWQTLLDTSPDHIYFKDSQSRFIKASKALARQFGVASPDEMAGKTDFDFFEESHARPAFEDEQEIIRTGRPMIAVEEREEWKDGRVTWASTTKLPLRDGAGNTIGIMGISRDITERKRIEDALRDSEALIRETQVIAGLGSYVLDVSSGLWRSSDLLDKVFGIDKNYERSVEGWTKLIHPDDRAMMADYFNKDVIGRGRPFDKEYRIIRQNDQAERWVHGSGRLEFDAQGRPVKMLGTIQEITERKRAEQQLVEAFKFNRKIISDASAGIVVFKASGRCVLANETAARTLNATVSQITEQDFRNIPSWHASGMLKVAEDTLATGEPGECEAHFISTFGKEVWLVCHFSHFVQNGEPHLLLIFSDFTERKKLEVQLMRAQRMESIGTLAGGIAHDLNNVLTPLLMSVQMLKEKIPDADAQATLEILETNVVRGASLIRQLLVFGRGIHGERITIQPKHIGRNISQIVDATFPKSIAFEFRSAAGLWPVTGDPTQIEQVLLNLCLNARDAMPRGGKLSIRMENMELGETDTATNLDARPGRHVVISVSDTGEGMTSETQDRIFEPFFTTKEHGKGTGLGLSTTLAIVKSHNGFITCYSELAKGSVFRVYLPASPGAEAVAKPAGKSSLPRGNNELVLVVDDEKPILNLAQTMLERFGYRVLPAANGAEALKIYASRQNEIAAVITDMSMPVMDGHAIMAALRAVNPKVRIISSSGLDANDNSANTANAAARRFIPKPYTLESMLNILHEVLQEDSVK